MATQAVARNATVASTREAPEEMAKLAVKIFARKLQKKGGKDLALTIFGDTEEATRWWLSLTPEQEDSMIRFLAGLPTWTRSATPRELAKLLVKKLIEEQGPVGATEILTGAGFTLTPAALDLEFVIRKEVRMRCGGNDPFDKAFAYGVMQGLRRKRSRTGKSRDARQ